MATHSDPHAKTAHRTTGEINPGAAPNRTRLRSLSGTSMPISRAEASPQGRMGGTNRSLGDPAPSQPHRSSQGINTDAGAIATDDARARAAAAQEGANTRTGIGSTGRPKSGTSTRSTTRRRALIQDYSEDEAEEGTTPPLNHPPIHKEHTTPYHDVDIDMQLENVSPEHGGSSLQISASQEEYMAVLNQAAVSLDRLDTFNTVDTTPPTHPHKSLRKEPANDTQSAKRRRSEGGRNAIDSGTSQPQHKREAIPSIDIVSKMWLGFSIHEAIATQKGMGIILEHRTMDEFEKLGTPLSEIQDFNSTRRAFPRVPQACYPNERPDAVPGHHLHFTQIPRHERVDPMTGLSEGFHVTIRFDQGFKNMSRQEARGACIERLHQMNIPLGSTYSNPIDIGTNAVTKNWAGFIKVHLKNPQQDGMALLKGHRAFVMQMEDGVRTIGKVEKGYELASKARSLRLHLKGEKLCYEHACTIFEFLVQESYYNGHQHEFMGLAKPELEKNFAFLTLTTEDTRDIVLREGLVYNNERLQVSLTRDRSIGNPSELRISTTLVANNLPQRESQSTITKAIKQLFGENNIMGVSYGTTNQDTTNKQAGWCHIQCLNTAVYTEWIHKSTFILGRRIDFIPHRGSIDGSDPNKTAIRLAQAPAREAIADKIQAMGNATNSNPLITERYLTKTMKEFEDKLDERFGSLTTSINNHTDKKHEATTTTITNHSTNLHALLGTIAHEFQQSNIRMQGFINGLSTAAPEIMHRTAPAPPHGPHTTAPPLPLQAPPGFQNNPQMYHQGPHTFNG